MEEIKQLAESLEKKYDTILEQIKNAKSSAEMSLLSERAYQLSEDIFEVRMTQNKLIRNALQELQLVKYN